MRRVFLSQGTLADSIGGNGAALVEGLQVIRQPVQASLEHWLLMKRA
jgi:hypothetical protein